MKKSIVLCTFFGSNRFAQTLNTQITPDANNILYVDNTANESNGTGFRLIIKK